MKKILVSAIAFSCFILSAAAQDKTSGKKDEMSVQQNHRKEMMQQLNLTADQKEKLKASREDFRTKMVALNEDESITVKDYRDKKDILRKEQKMQFMHILTADQKTKLQQIKKDNQAQRELMAAKKIDKLKTKLNLSDEQVAAIKANRQSQQAKVEAIMQNDSLSRIDKKEQLMTIKEANKDSLKTVLTADQYAKWQDLRKQEMEKRQEKMNGGIAQ
jgi:Spy/CpxP family protein refolding chaperone